MTWIIGNGSGTGFGMVLGDTRVSWNGGAITHDCLQKIYPVAQNMVAGFAGSVEMGMALVEDMRECFGPRAWNTELAAGVWQGRAKRMVTTGAFDGVTAHVILAGTSDYQREDTIWPDSYCVRMRSPDFVPELFAPPRWASIGTGAATPFAVTLSRQSLEDYYNKTAKLGPNAPVRMAMSIASQMMVHLMEQPSGTVGPVIQFGCASIDRVEIKTCQLDGSGYLAFNPVDPAGLVTSWPEFERWTGQLGLSAHAEVV